MIKKFIVFLFSFFVTLLLTIPASSQNIISTFLIKDQMEMAKLKEVRLKTLSGEDFNWDQTEGKIILINHWATWCEPCINELPSLQKLYNEKNGQIMFIFISYDKPSDVPPFMVYHKFSFPVYFISDRVSDDLITELHHVAVIPTTYIIPASHQCGYYYVGRYWDWYSPMVLEFLKNPHC